MDKLEKYANGWSKAEMDAFNIVMADPAMPDYKSPDYDDWLFHKAWQAALAAAPTSPATIPLETLVAEMESDPETKVALNEARKKDMMEGATVTEITTAQDEPVAYVSAYGLSLVQKRDGISTTVSLTGNICGSHVIPLYTRPADDKLREAIRLIASTLQAGEWAEHVDSDPDMTALEHEITRLVGDANQNAMLRQAAEDYLAFMDRDAEDCLEELIDFINRHTKNLRAALEGKGNGKTLD